MRFVIVNYEGNLESSKKRSATLLTFLFLISSTASIHFSAFEASATNNDQDADGLPYGIEFIINTQHQDWDLKMKKKLYLQLIQLKIDLRSIK